MVCKNKGKKTDSTLPFQLQDGQLVGKQNTGEKNLASVAIVLLNACKGSDPLVKGFSPSSFILGSACTLYSRSKCIWGGLTRSSRPNSS